MITNLLLIQEIARARNEKLIMIFIDLEKAFDSVNQGDILEMMVNRNIPKPLIQLFIGIYEHNITSLTINNEPIGEIMIEKGFKQGASTSPILFNLIMDELLRNLKSIGLGYSVNNVWMGAFAFADDLLLITQDQQEANQMLLIVHEWAT